MSAKTGLLSNRISRAEIARTGLPWARAALVTFLVLGSGIARTLADDQARAATPVAVVSARNFDDLTGSAERVLTTAGATMRASQLRDVLTLLDGLKGVDRDRPLGVLAYLPTVTDSDRNVEPDFIGFLPIDSMEDLQRSLSAIQKITLAPGNETGMWELRGERTTIPIRVDGGYAFVALREVLLADPLPNVAELTSAHEGYDLAVSLRRDGMPDELRDRAVADILLNLQQDAERDQPSGAGEREMHTRIVKALGWIFERSLRDVERATLGVRLPADSNHLEFAVTATVAAQTPLAEAVSRMPADASLFGQLSSGESPLAISAGGVLSGDVHEFAIESVDRLRRDVERRMQEDGTANGPAAAPIRQMLDAFTATVAAGRIDGCLVFGGEQPGAMSMLAAVRLEQADATASALEDFLPLIAETPAVADLELNAVQADGVSLHRITLQEVRKQDEWLYGPDVGLYLGAGRDALWLALTGFEREEQIAALLQRPPTLTRAVPPSLLGLDVRLKPWLMADDEHNDKRPRWLELAREAFADGGDRMHLELSAERNELRLRATLEEGYIRFAGAAWRARQQRSNPGTSPNLAAPVLPKQ